MKKIFLASKSPRRKQILTDAGIDFNIINSSYDEQLDSHDFSYSKIEALALNKALGAKEFATNDALIIGADTVVILDNVILTKPKDFDDAYNMLSALSNKTHNVVTSICVYDTKTNLYKLHSTTTELKFNKLTNEMITDYINSFKPYDKAGAYGIQELPEGFVKSINGDLENVIGISSNAVKSILQQMS